MIDWKDRTTQMKVIPLKDVNVYFKIVNVYVRFKCSYRFNRNTVTKFDTKPDLLDSKQTLESALSCSRMTNVFPNKILDTTFLTDMKALVIEEPKKYNLNQLTMF